MPLGRLALLATAALIGASSAAWAFCGFYVASTDEPLTNKASRVVLVHDRQQTVVTMASDVHGDPRQFALVIPVPTVVQRDQVRIVKPQTVEHLAEYTKPRLVEYYDPNPCSAARAAPDDDGHAGPGPGRARAQVAGDGGGGVLRRGIRHQGAVRARRRRAGRLAERQRLPHARGGGAGGGQLPAPGHAFLRGQA